MVTKTHLDRRQFLAAGVMTLAAAEFSSLGASPVAEGFGGLKQIDAGLLNVGIGVPTITIASDFDGAAADGQAYAKKFIGRHTHRILKGIGHNVPQEAPKAFAQAVIDVDGYSAT